MSRDPNYRDPVNLPREELLHLCRHLERQNAGMRRSLKSRRKLAREHERALAIRHQVLVVLNLLVPTMLQNTWALIRNTRPWSGAMQIESMRLTRRLRNARKRGQRAAREAALVE